MLTKDKRLIVFFIYALIGLIFLFNAPLNSSETVLMNYFVVLFSYYIVSGSWLYYIFKYGYYIFEPVTMVMGISIITYSIEPMISINIGDTGIAGFEVFGGCKKATIIYIIAMEIFLFVYYHNFAYKPLKKKHININSASDFDKNKVVEKIPNKKLYFAYFFAFFGAFIQVFDTISSGYSLEYIFTWGSQGDYTSSESVLGVFVNLRYFVAPAFLYLDKYASNKRVVLILRVFVFGALLVKTTRWFLIVLIISPIVLKYIEKRQKPKMFKLLVASIIVFFLIGIMQFSRGAVRDGGGITNAHWEKFTLYSAWEGFSGNFDLYKTLYGAVSYFPRMHSYTMGQQMILLTILTVIPRAIWPNKPTSIIDSKPIKGAFLGLGAVRGHWAYAQLTEYYIEFGIIGVCVCIFVFALFCKYLNKKRISPKSSDDLILYSFMFPVLMQLVIRGYTPINFWAIFFMVIPVIVIKSIPKEIS